MGAVCCIVALAAPIPAAGGDEGAPRGLREAAARHVEALVLEAPEPAIVPPSHGATVERGDGCPSAGPAARGPSASDCAGALGVPAGSLLGVALGAGLGFGLGSGTAGETLSEEFEPFGLTDALVTAGAVAVAWKGWTLLDRSPDPACADAFGDCRGPDESSGLDGWARRHGVWSSPKGRATADALSYGTLTATVALPPALLLASDQPYSAREMWLTVESAALTSAVLQVVKHAVHRPRPYARYCDPPCGRDLEEHGSRLSFFSGHAALAFSFAVSTGTIASMRGYRHSGWILGSGLTLAAATSYLRVAGDRHYLTDVLVGAAVGSAIGWAVPRLHGTRASEGASARRKGDDAALVVPWPLRGPSGGLWLHAGVGARGARLAVSLTF